MLNKTKMSAVAIMACLIAMSAPSFAMDDMKGKDDKECMKMVNTGNPDVDFIKNMIPHHQMAIDMAEKELDKGKDAEARSMAQKVIDAQKKEISEMKAWLKEHKE